MKLQLWKDFLRLCLVIVFLRIVYKFFLFFLFLFVVFLFFVFVLPAGARIDHGHSKNNAKRALYETLAFEQAIRAGLELVDPRDTLVMVTADHSHSMLITGYATRHNSLFGKLIIHLKVV